jgi:hypothetical protein
LCDLTEPLKTEQGRGTRARNQGIEGNHGQPGDAQLFAREPPCRAAERRPRRRLRKRFRRTAYGKGGAPRTLNFITGLSRSADIEQTLLLAHGPRRLHVVISG